MRKAFTRDWEQGSPLASNVLLEDLASAVKNQPNKKGDTL